MYRFEKTDYGWNCWKKQGNAYIYHGHYKTKEQAKEAGIEQ